MRGAVHAAGVQACAAGGRGRAGRNVRRGRTVEGMATMNDSRVRLPEPIVWRFDVGGQLRLIEMLSPREMEVLRLVAEGLSDKEIGATLHICRRTVRTHVSNIMQKLGARSRTDAVRIALQVGLFQSREPTSAQAAIALSAYYATLAQKLLQEGRL